MKYANPIIVFVDVQEKLTQVMHNQDELVPQLEKLLKGAQILDVPVLWLEQYPQGLGETVGSLKEILVAGGYSPIIKNCFSAMGSAEFRGALAESGADHVLLAGIESHVCVFQTARDLLLEENDVTVDVVVDCVSSRTKENKEIGIDRMVGYGAGVTSLESLLFELLETAEHPKFKEISRLIK
ncbi:isochorismatase family protein [Wohlfahrtiimonas chitiniclastica]|uniref:isochorismatase family protein n=1 Tax=Wohlfahrtiimonas chitiniclastica TaxID=400946 RepID=UPI0007B69CD4|nr:isochorismatase family protein [Wohlfahrtiimonas chitiniclastica]KZX36792.1 isochorismatase [Wohlfahrtiimonas chitiniclastica]